MVRGRGRGKNAQYRKVTCFRRGSSAEAEPGSAAGAHEELLAAERAAAGCGPELPQVTDREQQQLGIQQQVQAQEESL
eukprot:gene617-904_t